MWLPENLLKVFLILEQETLAANLNIFLYWNSYQKHAIEDNTNFMKKVLSFRGSD